MRSWILSLSAAALLLVSAPFYALWAQTPAGNPADPADQPSVPAAEQPATDTAELPGALLNAPADVPPEAQSPPSTERVTDGGPDAHLAAVLPPGMTRQDACSGFKSGPECLAALHVAHNLGIPFADLKSRVTAGARLTSAVTQLKPGTDAKAEVRKAQEQAQMDVRPPRG